MAEAFAQGFERVIAVGGDCPWLHEVNWTLVEKRLSGGPVVGPTTDGQGAYLIGMRRSDFDADAFAVLPWQTPKLLPALLTHLSLRADQGTTLLRFYQDINSEHHLLALLQRTSKVGVLGLLIARLYAILGNAETAPSTNDVPVTLISTSHLVRGPPALHHAG